MPRKDTLSKRITNDLRAIGTLASGNVPCNICGAAMIDEECVNGCKIEEQVAHSMKSFLWAKRSKYDYND